MALGAAACSPPALLERFAVPWRPRPGFLFGVNAVERWQSVELSQTEEEKEDTDQLIILEQVGDFDEQLNAGGLKVFD